MISVKFTPQNSFIVPECKRIIWQEEGFTGVEPLKLVRQDVSSIPVKSFGNVIANNKVINAILDNPSLFSFYQSQTSTTSKQK
jgi:hypothetical protein